MTCKSALIALAAFAAACPASASSDDAWAEFATTVREKCLEASTTMLADPSIVVDPFGSQSYGLAVLTGMATGTTTKVTYLCVMDKKTQAAELGSELGPDAIDVKVLEKAD